MTKTFDFSGTNVVVTGGARGIGFQIVKDFLEAGSSVTIWDYDKDTLDASLKELSAFEGKVKGFQVDVTDVASCNEVAKSTGSVDVLINNAGITRDKSLKKMTLDDFQKVIDTNLTGLFNVTKSFLDQELFSADSGRNRIINMASVVALYGNFGQTNYVASKAGVIGMTKTWAKELGRKGFTANAIAPGFIETPMTAKMPEEVLQSIVSKVPVQRMGRPEDIAQTCMFLASEAASYINGTVISVDGGVTL
ncbi:MAG: 3-oxoacyl-ACP reductase FabG [Bdellovibrionales bacterium]|nr:3-oxoacyl-ACP reductase FabG [Bdellovibrionales bacterium]